MKLIALFASFALASAVAAGNVTVVDADQGLSYEEFSDDVEYTSPLLAAGEARSLSRKAHHRDLASKLEKRYRIYKGGQGTYYYGKQLDRPFCGGPTPTDDTMAIAVPKDSPAQCHDWVHLHYNGKVVTAKVVDRCAGCANIHSVDMTKAVFKQLAPLDKGRLYDLHMRVM